MISDLPNNTRLPCSNIGSMIKRVGDFILEPGSVVDVPLSLAKLYGWDQDLCFNFSEINSFVPTRTTDGKLLFDWWCPVTRVDGYGRHALDIFKGFQFLNCKSTLRDVGWVDRLFVSQVMEEALAEAMYLPPNRIGVTMSLPYDNHIHEHQSRCKIVVTQFETDHIPAKHIENVNRCDHLIVTSKYQPQAWVNSGCQIPISVITPGVDVDYFLFKERTPNYKFRVLLLGAITERKNPLGAIRVFKEASAGDPDWEMTIKTRRTDAVDRIQKAIGKDPCIKLEVGDSHPDFVKRYYYTHDCLLWLSKGEGVGLPPLEAMSTGMEVVCSANSGMLDYVKDEHCYPVSTSHLEPADCPGGFEDRYVKQFGSVGNWWVPDENHAVKQLKRCFSNWVSANSKGKRAAEYVKRNHTLKIQSESVVKVIEQYE